MHVDVQQGARIMPEDLTDEIKARVLFCHHYA